MSMPAPLIAIRDLVVDFETGARTVRALHGVSLTVRRGEALGIVGESGSGKSVTWLAALRLLGGRARTAGQVLLDGTDLLAAGEDAMTKVRGKRIAMIFQDPTSSLNPVHRIGTQLAEALRLHKGLGGTAAWAEARRLLDRVNIPAAAQRLGEYPHELSGGMNQRVMIAMAIAGEPDLLVADEPTTALDVTIQAQILELLKDMRRDLGMGLIIISHDLGVVAELADRVAVMYGGRIVEEAPVEAIFEKALHPYTEGLIAALPEIDGPAKRLVAIPGQVPEPWNLPPGCSFAPRCPRKIEACDRAVPELTAADGNDRRAACVLASEARPAFAATREVA